MGCSVSDESYLEAINAEILRMEHENKSLRQEISISNQKLTSLLAKHQKVVHKLKVLKGRLSVLQGLKCKRKLII